MMTLSNPVVLVVEDNALIRFSAMELVSSAGFEAVEAESADQAIAILESRPDIHLVFTDVEMPGSMDGIKLVQYVRERWPRIYLIVASGKAILDESQLPPGSRFFAKPYNDHAIVEEMTRMLTAIDFKLGRSDNLGR